MKTNRTTLSLAVLNAQIANTMAVCNANLSLDEDGWAQLFPAGAFKPCDGREVKTKDGLWHMDAQKAEAFIAATKAIREKVLIDYDHQTLHTEQTGQKAPAAAWLSSDKMEWREGKGLYIKPDWTDTAQEHIDKKEYAYLSAVFPYSEDGTPIYLRMAAITNDPGLVGMESVAALTAEYNLNLSRNGVSLNLYGYTEDEVLNEQLKKLLERLGITVEGDITPELSTVALTAVDALIENQNKVNDLEDQVATLSAQKGDVDLTKFVAIEAYNGVVQQLAALKAGTDEAGIEDVIKTAREEGKIVEAEVDYLTSFGKQQGLAALKASLKGRAPIAALKSQQTTTVEITDQKKELDDDQVAILKATGLTKEQFLKAQENDDE